MIRFVGEGKNDMTKVSVATAFLVKSTCIRQQIYVIVATEREWGSGWRGGFGGAWVRWAWRSSWRSETRRSCPAGSCPAQTETGLAALEHGTHLCAQLARAGRWGGVRDGRGVAIGGGRASGGGRPSGHLARP